MARKKAEVVSMDEVRDEMAETPVEGDEVNAEVEQAEGEVQPEEVAPYLEGEAYKVIDDVRIVRVELSKDELIEQGRIMIEALDEAERARASLKALSAECKANEEHAREKANEAKALMRSRHEARQVACHQVHNWTRNKVYTVRQDTGEVIGIREMNNYEKQVEITEPTPAENDAETDADSTNEVDDMDFGGELAGVAAGDSEETSEG